MLCLHIIQFNNIVIFDEPSIEDTTKYKITVQRWFDIFDFLDKKKIEYDQVCMVDASYIPKWDCPDFFELTDNKFATFQEQEYPLRGSRSAMFEYRIQNIF